jgi:hypothetical protein
MKKLFIALVLLLGTVACASYLYKNGAHRKTAQNETSMEDMARINNIVMQTFDRASNLCKVSEDDIFMLPQKWQALVDERFRFEKDKFLSQTETQREALWPAECEQTCSCGFYVNFLEYLDQSGVKLSERGQRRLMEMSKIASRQDPGEAKCVAGAASLCKSSVFLELTRAE